MRTLIGIKSKDHGEGGYSLLEVAIVVAIVGVFIAFLSGGYHIYRVTKAKQTTSINTQVVLSNFSSYLSVYGRYPCPAPINVKTDSPDYGSEGDCSDTAVAVGDCAGGICVEESERTVTLPDTTVVRPRVRRGGVPFRSLNIPEEHAYDGWGNRLEYAVTERLAVRATYNRAHGGISVVDTTPARKSMIDPPDAAHFIVFSHGPNKVGAYNREGFQERPCAGAALDVDVDNCQTTPANNRAVYRTGFTKDGFDDFVQHYSTMETAIWSITPGNPNNIQMLGDGLAGAGGRPASGDKFEVDGNLRASGNVHSDELCMTGGAPCFRTANIVNPGMQCPPGQFMIGIRNAAPECAPANTLVGGCGAGMRMTGINADRTPICTPALANCGPEDVTRCSGTTAQTIQTLPPTRHGQSVTLIAGASRAAVYQCNNGVWSWVNGWGVCECTPSDVTATLACATGYVGAREVRTEVICPSGDTVTTVLSDTCTCVPGSFTTIVQPCDPGYTGDRLMRRELDCATGNWTAYAEVSNTCTCNPAATETTNWSCPTGFSGQRQVTRSFSCPPPQWSPWTEVSNTCACAPGQTETRTASCPPWHTGEITEQRTFNCATRTWSSWTATANTCTPITCRWKDKTSGTYGMSPIGKSINSVCACGSDPKGCYSSLSGTGYMNFPVCECQPQ